MRTPKKKLTSQEKEIKEIRDYDKKYQEKLVRKKGATKAARSERKMW